MAFGFGFGMGFPLRNTVVAPTLSMDFAGNPTLPATVDFTRGTNATFTNSAGNLQLTAGVNDPRFDYNPTTLVCKGLLIESQRTNSIRNNTMVGAVAGTPGTQPTNWVNWTTTVSGITTSIAGVGIDNGISYIDWDVSGTYSGTTGIALVPSFETGTQVGASVAQTWTESVYLKLQAGAIGTASFSLRMSENDGSGVGLISGNSPPIIPTATALTASRATFAMVTTDAGIVYISPRLRIGLTNGETYNFTIRVGLPQLELGQFATSVIPTSTAAATRNADLATMTGTNFSSWYNQDQSTVVTKIVQGVPGGSTSANLGLFALRTASFGATFNGYAVREVPIGSGTGSFRAGGRSGATLAEISGPSLGFLAVGTSYTTAASFNASTISIAVNGIAGSTGGNTVSSLLLPRDTLDIGKQSVGGLSPFELNGHVASFTYYPMSLSMATLQALSV
jgi:hypothetical protein